MARATSAPVPAAKGKQKPHATASTHRIGVIIAVGATRLRFVTFQLDANIEPGVLVGGQIIGLRGAGFESVLAVIEGGADALDRVSRWVRHPLSSELPDMAAVALQAPIPRPPKIICIGLNYRDHAAETKMPIPEVRSEERRV